MARFEITSPDGKRWEVSAPDGATEAQVLDYAKAQWAKTAKPPVEDPGFGESVKISAGKTIDAVLNGLTQMYLGARGEDSALSGLKTNVDRNAEIYKRLQQERPFATGIGEALPSMIIPAGGGATLGANMARMATAGAAPGLLEYGTVGERLGRGAIGAVAGAAVPALVAGAKTIKSAVEPLYQSGREAIVGRMLNRVTESDPMARARMMAATELIPGSKPTAAQVAQSGGVSALERAASAMNPEAYTQRAMEQSSARLNALRGIAGDDQLMKSAVNAREAASGALYSQADAGVAPIDSFFSGLMARPQFKAAVSRAQELAKNEGLADIFFRGQNGEPVALLGQGAHYIKKALDEAAEYGAASYTGKAGASAAGRTNEAFQKWLDQSIPEYGLAKAEFAAKSVPINQMQIGQSLLEKVQPALADYGALARETGATYARGLRDADALAASATGLSGAKMANVLTPQQMATVENVARDLARKANAQDLGRGVGSDTFQKLSMSNIAEQSGMPRIVGGLLELPGVSRAAAWTYRETDQKMQRALSDALLDPKAAAQLMVNADKKWLANNPKTRAALEQVAMRGGGLLAMSLTPPGQ